MKIIGHRGACGLAPENTLASLQKGLDHHVDMLEFDIRVTKDGIVILHHDANLKTRNGQHFPISGHTYDELKAQKPDLATFDEALDLAGKQVPLYVEVKPGVKTAPIVKIIKKRLQSDWLTSDLMLGSKSQQVLVELHQALPEITKIVIEPWSGVRAVRRAKQVNTQILSMNQWFLWWGFIKPITKRGYTLYTYTLNDVKKARRWQKYGLAGVVTDFPDQFQK